MADRIVVMTHRPASIRSEHAIALSDADRDPVSIRKNADDTVNVEAVAAQAAGVIDVGARLATELGQGAARYLTVELEDLNVVLAPFGDELMLVLVGRRSALACVYRIAAPGS